MQQERPVPYVTLVALLLGRIGVEGFLSTWPAARFASTTLLVTAVAATAGAVADRGRTRLFLAFGALIVCANFASEIAGLGSSVGLASLVVAFGMIATTAVLILRDVLRMQVTDLRTLAGGVAVYLLLSSGFSVLHLAIERFAPGSYAGPAGPLVGPEWASYFSIVTITGVGYGEITPASGPARSVAALEAVVGQLYLTILVGRLVGLELQGRASFGEGEAAAGDRGSDRSSS